MGFTQQTGIHKKLQQEKISDSCNFQNSHTYVLLNTFSQLHRSANGMAVGDKLRRCTLQAPLSVTALHGKEYYKRP